MVSHSLAVLMVLVAVPTLAFGQVEPASKTEPANSAPELPASPSATPAAPAANATDEIRLEEWNRADWELVQPKTTLLDLHGYYRLRTDLFRRLNFGNGTSTEYEMRQAVPRYPALIGSNADFTGANMRLRLSPTINASENVQVFATLDVLDNIILGSTPNTVFATDQVTPLNILNRSQASVKSGTNAISDSINIRHLYAKLHALNEQIELRFGRMPSEFGLGMMNNAGDCPDCDNGDVADRIALTFKLADLLFVPMFDWISSGPYTQPFTTSSEALDLVPWDDSEQYSIRLLKLDSPEAINERVASGQSVFNWGLWSMWRRQARDLSASYYTSAGTTNAEVDPAVTSIAEDRRNSNIFIGDGYMKWYSGNLELGLEGGAVIGSFLQTVSPLGDDGTASVRKIGLNQFGGALEAAWRFKGDYDGTALSLKAGAASGDSAPGFGAIDRANTQFGYVQANNTFDSKITNFQFNPDYEIDMLMFHRIIGTVTDAWYARPQVSALFGNNVGGRLAAIYSQAIMSESTPNGSSLPLGLELDAELSYGILSKAAESGPFKASLAGGVLLPLSGFKNLNLTTKQSGSFAWTIQSRLYVTF